MPPLPQWQRLGLLSIKVIVGLILLVGLLVVACNWSLVVSLQVPIEILSGSPLLTSLLFGPLLLAVVAVTVLSVTIFRLENALNRENLVLQANKKRAVAEVSAEYASEYVKALEAKVKTLETALDNALKSKTPPLQR